MGISTHETLKRRVTDPLFFRNVLVPPLIPAEDLLIMFYIREKAGGQAQPPLSPSTDLGRARLFPGRVRSSSTEPLSASSAGLSAEHPTRAKHCARSLFPAKQRHCWDYPGGLPWLLGSDDFDLLWPSSHLTPSASEVHLRLARLNPIPIYCALVFYYFSDP